MKALLLSIIVGLTAGAVTQYSFPPPKPFRVGVGPVAPGVRAATAPGGSLTVARGVVCINPDGSERVQLLYSNAAGQPIHSRMLLIDAACSVVTDSFGNTVSSSGPASCVSGATHASALDTAIGNAATGGKLNL